MNEKRWDVGKKFWLRCVTENYKTKGKIFVTFPDVRRPILSFSEF